jgi:acetylornithine deacetylase/succinyl-diaminopimelate desuccinylase-like protein
VTRNVTNGSKLGSPRAIGRGPATGINQERDAAVNNNEMAELLGELVAIPTISSDPSRRRDIARSAEVIAAQLVARNFAVTIAEDGGALPTVIATRGLGGPLGGSGNRHNEAQEPTVLLYSHHDVQPIGNPAPWSTDPFTLTRRGTVLFGRGSGDNKAGIVAHLAAIDALDDLQHPLAIVVVVDGGEEIGSPGFDEILSRHLRDIDPQLIVVNDGINFARGVPSLTTSLRGFLDVDLTVSVMDEPTHSGIHGGGVIDAISALSRLIATLHSDDGSVAVTGLDTIGTHNGPVLTEAEYRTRLGIYPDVIVTGAEALIARLWASAAIAVIGIDAPSVAESSNVIVPSARARLSVRLPPGIGVDEASDALQQHLRSRRPFGARLNITVSAAAEPWSNTSKPTAVVRSLEEAWGTPVVEMGGGGGIPVVSAFATAYPHATIAITAICDPDSRVHGINENVDLVELQRAATAEVAMLRAVGRPPL